MRASINGAPPVLPRIRLFENMPAGTVERIYSSCEKRKFEDGENIVFEGETANCMFIILSGRVNIFKKSSYKDENSHLTVLKAGDIFGEMPLFKANVRMATAESNGGSTILILPYDLIARLKDEDIHSYAGLITNVARTMVERLQKADAIIANFYFRLKGLMKEGD